LDRLKAIFGKKTPTAQERARSLIKAVDAGGIPLHAGIVNDIARGLGLDVKSNAPVEVTIERIRKLCLKKQCEDTPQSL
jgi:hypothetical protein